MKLWVYIYKSLISKMKIKSIMISDSIKNKSKIWIFS